MAIFTYNNIKNISTSHTPFKNNCDYHPHTSYKKDVDFYSWLKLADELINELKKLMTVYRKNLQHAQDLQNQHQNKAPKPRSYTLDNKVWLNSKYIQIK